MAEKDKDRAATERAQVKGPAAAALQKKRAAAVQVAEQTVAMPPQNKRRAASHPPVAAALAEGQGQANEALTPGQTATAHPAAAAGESWVGVLPATETQHPAESGPGPSVC